MKKWFKILLLVHSFALLSGCWNREELPEKAFVMGIAVNKPEPDKVKIMVQLFKPSQKTAGRGNDGSSFSNIETTGSSTFEAVRDITLRLGRKTQWGHTRILIIDEDTAKHNHLLSLLELFYRDHETRITTKVVIAREESAELLKQQPIIEMTSSQQMNRMQEVANRFAGKVPDMTLLKLARNMKSEVGDTMVPLIGKSSNELVMIGSAAFHQGLLAFTLNSRQTQDLLMLTNQFHFGVVKVPCEDAGGTDGGKYESIEVQSVRSVVKPVLSSGALRINARVNLKGNIAELHCTRLDKPSSESAYNKRIEQVLRDRIMGTIKFTQQQQVDLLGIGNMLYRNHNRTWKQWKPDWNKRYAKAQIDMKVTVQLNNSLTTVEKPIFAQ